MNICGKYQMLKKLQLFAGTVLLMVSVVHGAMAAPSQTPLFLKQAASPIITLVLSMDHELFKKAYNDYSDLDAGLDGIDALDGRTAESILSGEDLTFRPTFPYYGYFDNQWCYSYNTTSGYFEPDSLITVSDNIPKTYDCDGKWSGNFLNWATMTRMDIIRQVLYGGMRSTDTTALTVLERSYLPRDSHAFVKTYGGSDLIRYTPFDISSMTASNGKSGLSICNVSTDDPNTHGELSTTKKPILRFAKGIWPQWAATEQFQCWDTTLKIDGINKTGDPVKLAIGDEWNSSIVKYVHDRVDIGVNTPKATISAGSTGKINSINFGDYLVVHSKVSLNARVAVCVDGKDGNNSNARCRKYPNSGSPIYKPIGILQRHGESGKIKYALLSGSYAAGTKGGVLRKKASYFANYKKDGTEDLTNDEVSLKTGIFNAGLANSIVKNINAMRIGSAEFHYTGYKEMKYMDCLDIYTPRSVLNVKAGGICRDWGNPIAEIYYEALRYVTGKETATSSFAVTEADVTANSVTLTKLNLTNDTWDDPFSYKCQSCSIIVLSTGANSFDGDDLTNSQLTGTPNINTFTNTVGDLEFGDFSAGSYYGGSSADGEQRCTARTGEELSAATGVCPESPAAEGTYKIAGLAYWAKTKDIRTDFLGDQHVDTYTVDMAETLPKFEIPLGNNKFATIVPACESKWNGSGYPDYMGCSLLNVTVETAFNVYDGSGVQTAGSFLFYWEDALWGNDYDLDLVQRIHWCVGSTGCATDGGVGSSVSAGQLQVTSSMPYGKATKYLRVGYNISGISSTADGVIPTGDWSIKTNGGDFTTPITKTTLTAAYAAPSGSDSTKWAATIKTKTFTPGTATTVRSLKKPLYYAAKYGGFDDKDGDGVPDNDNPATTTINESEWDADGNGSPDNYFDVKNPSKLEESLNLVLTTIQGRVASASSAAVSSTRLSEGSFVYQARFNSTFWAGELVAYKYGGDGVLESTPSLNSTTVMKNNNTTNLKIWTSPSHSSGTAVPFEWDNLSDQQKADIASAPTTTLDAAQTTLGQARLAWIKGVSTKEVAGSSPLLRSRTNVIDGVSIRNIIGDIVDSSPVYDGPKDLKYDTLPVGGSGYASYLIEKGKKTPRIFVGANDGMIHSFNAKTLAYSFSYLPPSVYPNLDDLTQTSYGTAANEHKFFVNGQITVGDAYLPSAGSTDATRWRTVLVAALGAGGKNVFALDITDNTPKLLFSFDASSQPKMGYVMGKPFIVPMKNGRFAAVFGNGYEAGTTTTSLFVVDLDSPGSSNTRVIDAAASAIGNGLSTPALLPDIKGRVEYAYAGDLKGNMWRFNLNNATPSNWVSSGKIFTAKDDSNKPQPIFAAPTLGYNALRQNQVMVYFGTGKYFEDTDLGAGTTVNSFYAVLDEQVAYTRTNLLEKEISGSTKRTITNDNSTLWNTASNKGWYMDFPLGERVTIKPLLLFDRLIFPTLIPSDDPCGFGGSSWLMEVIAVGNKASANPLLGEILKDDYLVLGDLSFGIVPTLDDTGQIIISTSEGKIELKDTNLPTGFGRINWRQLD